MKRILHIFRQITALFTGILLLFSCIKEDTSECIGEVRVYFSYSPQTIHPADVDRMHLYVFSHNGYFVGEYRDNFISGFNADYFIDCSDLLPGSYRFIAWGGKDERYYATSPTPFVTGQTTFDEALLMLEHSGNTLSTPVHHIFHSDLSATVLTTLMPQRFYMPLAQLSNTINISTVGLSPQDGVFTFRITDTNCTYTFDRSFASHDHEPFTYMAPCTKDNENQLHSTLNVLRLAANRRTPQLQIINETTGVPLYPVGAHSGDLIGLILSATPNNNFDVTHTYDIVLTFTGDESTGFDVEISVNGWKVNKGETVLID